MISLLLFALVAIMAITLGLLDGVTYALLDGISKDWFGFNTFYFLLFISVSLTAITMLLDNNGFGALTKAVRSTFIFLFLALFTTQDSDGKYPYWDSFQNGVEQATRQIISQGLYSSNIMKSPPGAGEIDSFSGISMREYINSQNDSIKGFWEKVEGTDLAQAMSDKDIPSYLLYMGKTLENTWNILLCSQKVFEPPSPEDLKAVGGGSKNSCK